MSPTSPYKNADLSDTAYLTSKFVDFNLIPEGIEGSADCTKETENERKSINNEGRSESLEDSA